MLGNLSSPHVENTLVFGVRSYKLCGIALSLHNPKWNLFVSLCCSWAHSNVKLVLLHSRFSSRNWNTSLQLLKLDCFFSGGEQGLSCIHACLILLSQASVTYLLCPASYCIPVAGLSLEKEYLKLFHSVCRTHLSSVNFVCLQLLILFWAQSTVFWWRNCILKTVNLIIS